MSASESSPHDVSYRLWRQVLAGDPDGAMQTIEAMDRSGMPVLTADLLARLYVRAGRFAEARALWRAILQADPHYEPAVKAYVALGSHWLVFAVARKFSCWFGLGLLAVLGVFGLGMLAFGFADPAYPVIGAGIVFGALGAYLFGLFAWVFLALAAEGGFLSPSPTGRERSESHRPPSH